MVYEKKYPITHLRGEYLLLEWERGYKNTFLYFKDRLICKVDSITKLKEGFRVDDEELGLIELRFSEKPISVDIIVNGLHCENNASHPRKKIKSISSYFYMLGAFAILGTILAYAVTPSIEAIVFLAIVDLPFIVLYFICAVFASKGKIWPVYTGFIVFCFFTLISVLNLVIPGSFFSNSALIFSLIFRVTLIVLMVPYIKMAVEIPKYRKYQLIHDGSVIDNI